MSKTKENIREIPKEDTGEWEYDSFIINLPDVLNPLYQCFFMREKATGKRWVYSRRRNNMNSKWENWKKYIYDE